MIAAVHRIFIWSMLSVGLSVIPVSGHAQVWQPPTPQQVQPVYGPPNESPYPRQYQQPGIPVRMGATANDIQRQQYDRVPFSGGVVNPRDNQKANHDYILRELRKSAAYNPQLRNPNDKQFQISANEELQNIFGSITPAQLAEDYNSKEFAEKTKPFNDALRSLKSMLAGKQKLSVSEAYFTMENAFGESYLTRQEFRANLDKSADFMKAWMAEHNLSQSDNEAIHYTVQKFMSEPLHASSMKTDKDGKKAIGTVFHDPFCYDFSNYSGENDNRDFYVTKCLATGMGQCNSMSVLYLCLAEAMKGKAYLAFAPIHALVKYPDNKGNLRNYEATSNWDITDKWYLDNMFISKRAQQTGVYLTPYNAKQIVANCILDLALGYQRRVGAADGKFIQECINSAKPYFPKNNNVQVYFAYSNMYGNQLGRIMKSRGISRVENAMAIPEAKALYEKWRKNEAIIEDLGYNNMPAGLYEEMMKHYEFRGREQHQLKLDGRRKHDLFRQVKM